MKNSIHLKQILALLMCCFLTSCEDFLEVEAPDHKIVSETVFNNDETALSAMTGIYNQLASVSFSSGGPSSVSVLAGLSSDNLSPIRETNLPFMEFEQHSILPNNFRNLDLWTSAYNIIYMTNSLLEGLVKSENISIEVRNRLEGESKFVRAFTYFYLVNLYGEVPLILSTDYRENSMATRDSELEIYRQIIEDLQVGAEVLNNDYTQGERIQVNRYTAIALLARVNLYLQGWDQAEALSSQIIAANAKYQLLEDLNQVFLANSLEAIWQISPRGRGAISTHTQEGAIFIIHPFLTFLSHLKLTDSLVASLESEDQRLLSWIQLHQSAQSYYSFKYKIRNSTNDMSEYSMVLRLAEQYLIRAEARAMQNNLSGAIADLDRIRSRAGLAPIAEINSGISKEELIELIMEERKRELFTEWGHRWLDLKRTGSAGEVLGERSLWQETDLLYPIPETERVKNPNLSQNDGY